MQLVGLCETKRVRRYRGFEIAFLLCHFRVDAVEILTTASCFDFEEVLRRVNTTECS